MPEDDDDEDDDEVVDDDDDEDGDVDGAMDEEGIQEDMEGKHLLFKNIWKNSDLVVKHSGSENIV